MRKITILVMVSWVSLSVTGSDAACAEDFKRLPDRDLAGFHLASATPVRGYEKMAVGHDGAFYVSPIAAFTAANITSAEAADRRDGTDVLLTLTGDVAKRFGTLLDTRGARYLAIMTHGGQSGVGVVSFNAAGGVVTISDLDSAQVERIMRMLGGDVAVPTGPVMTVMPARLMLLPGGSTTLEVFVGGVSNLRAYQATPTVTRGTSGSLFIEDAWIDTDRPGYVFRGLDKLDAVDRIGGRVGALLLDGGVDASDASYLGSYTVRASSDASGTFHVNVGADGQSLLLDSDNLSIPFTRGRAATITVEVPMRATGE